MGALSTNDSPGRLLKDLSNAKTWPEQFKQELEGGADVSSDIREAGKKIAELETRAKEAMKRLGCVTPETRLIYQGMADMLINWQMFKDSLG